MSRPTTLSLTLLAAALVLTACSTPSPQQQPTVIREAGVSTAPPPSPAPVAPAPETSRIAPVNVTGAETFNPLKEFSIYFELDQYTVDDKQISLLRRHADYIKKNPSQRVSVQGNTDERGSREYNLSLGQKRAEAVKKLLVTEGARDAQIEAVSLGEEKPQDPGRNETAWAKNRRSDITYPK